MKLSIIALAIGLAFTSLSADVKKGEFGASRNDPASTPKATPEKRAEKPPRPAEKLPPKKSLYPFHGTVDSVDAEKKTLTLRGKAKPRLILLTADTRIQKNGAKAKLEDAISGERVTGSVRKNGEGREEAITVRFGEKETP